MPADVAPERGSKDFQQEKKGFLARFKSRITDEKESALENMAILLQSGMGIRSALRSLNQNTKKDAVREQIEGIASDVGDGKPLWKSFDRNNFVPPYIISLIRIGEESGNLGEKLEDAVETLKKEKKHRSQLRSAMFYPSFILIMAFIVSIGLTWFVLPRLGQVFDSLDAELPFITRWLLAVGEIMSAYGIYIVPSIIVALLVIGYFLFFFGPTRGIGQWILFHLPIVHRLIMYTEVSRFAFNLSMLLSSGIPINQSIQTLEEVQEYYMYQRFIRKLGANVSEGYSFQYTFEENASNIKGMFPYTVQELVAAGESSGQLPKVLDEIGKRYEEKTDDIASNMGKLIEPFLLIVVWVIVVFLALAILLPIYNLVGDFSV
ncbi:MAG: hypothetical protein BRC23_00390 [Parcubacteria group bacterium SW_4_49_11]|nr:MAG: hypothetical protein BRC23_00390 [Parcubacteria group bacterium SW_4_49_11]